jgi:hypothetical protein
MDYIPTIFSFDNCTNLVAQIKGNVTFKKSLKELDTAIRNVADDVMHNPAKKQEYMKVTKQTIDNQQGNLLIVLESVIKQLQSMDLRDNGNKLIESKSLIPKEKPYKTQLEIFEDYIENEEWYEEDIDHKHIWICKKDNLYQIHEGDDYDDFSEPWTQVYPDSLGSGKNKVLLYYNNNLIKNFTFIYCDGGRINVVLPRREINHNNNLWEGKDLQGGTYKNVTFYWEKNSLGYKLTQLIGSFYIYDSIEGVARISKIEIR